MVNILNNAHVPKREHIIVLYSVPFFCIYILFHREESFKSKYKYMYYLHDAEIIFVQKTRRRI